MRYRRSRARGAQIGSLYRFFPNKEAVADSLVQRHIAVLEEEYAALAERAATLAPDALADILIELLVTLHPRVESLSALMEARTDKMEIRDRARGHAVAGIAAALRVCAPRLDEALAKDIAAVVLNLMKVLRGMMAREAPGTPGAPRLRKIIFRRKFIVLQYSPRITFKNNDTKKSNTEERNQLRQTRRSAELTHNTVRSLFRLQNDIFSNSA